MLEAFKLRQETEEVKARAEAPAGQRQPRELSREELSAIRGGKTRHDYVGTVDLGDAFRREIINSI